MKNSLKLVATVALSALCFSAFAQTTPPATGTTPDGSMSTMQDGKMKGGKMKHDKMHKGKMKDGMEKTKMSDDKMKTKM